MSEYSVAFAPDRRSLRKPRQTLARKRHARRLAVIATRMLVDGLSMAISTAAASAFFAYSAGLRISASNLYVWSTLAVVLGFFIGVYQGAHVGPVGCLRRRIHTFCLLATVAVATAAVERQERLAVAFVVTTAIALAIPLSHYSEAFARRLLARFGLWGARVAILGRDEASRELARVLNANPELGICPIGVLDFAAGPLPDCAAANNNVLSLVDFLIFSSADSSAALQDLPSSSFPAKATIAPPVSEIEDLPLQARYDSFGAPINRELFDPANLRLKRILDLLIAIPLFAVVAPVVAALALAVICVDGGPAFYIQERQGKDGRAIGVLKLRTMRVDAETRLKEHLERDPEAMEEWRRHFKLANDPRVLPIIGRFMRQFSLDELPQIINVLLGDMSLVGPRPFPTYHMQAFDDRFRQLRASVPPGVTGLWQITSRSDADLEAQRALDTRYIRNWSIWLDLYILLQTAPAVLAAKGAR